MYTIIVATDFSEDAENAADFAADLAAAIGAKLHLFHTYVLQIPITDLPYPLMTLGEVQNSVSRKLDELRERQVTRTGGRVPVNYSSAEGAMLHELSQLSQRIEPYAVVIGGENATAIERLFGGGKALAAVHSFEWPLFLIPPLARFTGFRNVGLACDLRNVIETIRVDDIRRFVTDFHATLHILHAGTDQAREPDDASSEEVSLLGAMFSEFAPKYHYIYSEDEVSSILQYAGDNNLDLLIIVPKKHDLIERIFRRSRSKMLVMQTHMPLLSLHE